MREPILSPPCCAEWDQGVGGPCPLHGGKWSDCSTRCPECGKDLACGPSGKIRPHKPFGRNSPGWYGPYKNRPMTERFEFNKCPGAGQPSKVYLEFMRKFGVAPSADGQPAKRVESE